MCYVSGGVACSQECRKYSRERWVLYPMGDTCALYEKPFMLAAQARLVLATTQTGAMDFS